MATTNGVTANEATTNGAKANGAPGERESVDISVALRANDLEKVPAILASVAAAGDKLSAEDNVARLELLERARDLVRALETPRETMIKHCWAQPTALSALVCGVNTGLFKLMAKDGGSAKKAEELAETLGIQAPVLSRLMRHLSAMGYITEVAADEYRPTNFTRSLTIPVIGDGYPVISNGVLASLVTLPNWLAEHGFQTPNDVFNGPYQAAYATKLNFFEWLQANPPNGVQFNHHMGGYRQGRPSWMDSDFYPVQDRLVKGADTSAEAVLLVDIGGNIGHDLDEFRHKHPQAPGRLILQDLPIVIGQIKELDGKIERMAYDFHTEQPVHGARAYYMHSCLHDWPDEVCGSILGRIRAAMRPGYSKLLINENVIPGTAADWQATALDVLMMALLSSRERTEADWRKLLGENGFTISGIWSTKKLNGVESLIECELA